MTLHHGGGRWFLSQSPENYSLLGASLGERETSFMKCGFITKVIPFHFQVYPLVSPTRRYISCDTGHPELTEPRPVKGGYSLDHINYSFILFHYMKTIPG